MDKYLTKLGYFKLNPFGIYRVFYSLAEHYLLSFEKLLRIESRSLAQSSFFAIAAAETV